MSASSDTFSAYKRFRPLIPKPAAPGSLVDLRQPTYTSIAAAADFHGDQLNPDPNAKIDRLNNISYNFKHIQNHSKLLHGAAGIGNCGASAPAVTSRWNPTADQLRILEDLYKRGIRTPTAEQIQYITAQLRCYGKIEGKNVFYWFQNHKARERQKRRRRLMEMSAAGLLPLRIDFPQPWERFSRQHYSGANVASWSDTNTKMKMKMTRLPPRPRNTFAAQEPVDVEDFLRLATPSAHDHEECTTVQVNYLRSISQTKRCNSGRRGLCNPNPNPTEQHERSSGENYVIEKAYHIGPERSESMQCRPGIVAKDEAADSAETSNTVLIDEEQGELRFHHRDQSASRTSKPNQLITLELFPLYSESMTDYNSTHCDNTLSAMSSEAEVGCNFLFDLKSKCDGTKIGENQSVQGEERFSHYTAYFHEFLPLHSNN